MLFVRIQWTYLLYHPDDFYLGLAVAKSSLDMSAEEMHRQIDVNVVGLTLCAKEAINQMRQNGVDDGHVVNVCYKMYFL